jgi:hypothetical protein
MKTPQRTALTIGLLLLGGGIVGTAQTPLDLGTLFDTDAILESGGAGIGDPLDGEGRRIDAGTLPADYQDGTMTPTQDGRAQFQFAPLKQSSRDAVAINGQRLTVPEGQYGSVDLALLATPGAFVNPFTDLQFEYADGSSETARLGPVAGWFNSPTAFDHTLFRFIDNSEVQTIVDFPTDFSDQEAVYLLQELGNGNAGGTRFIDGNGYALYWIGNLAGIQEATLGVTVGNNFVISLATEYWDPDVSTTDGYTVVANSMEIYDGFEHRALGNLKQYDIDVAPFLAKGTGQLYILLTDATPENGWGPFLQRISLFTGTVRTFEETLEPPVDTSGATVHAMFTTDTDDEAPYLYDNSGSGPSNRGHRFADGNGSITYRFDLPDDVSEAKITMDLANNFVVSLAGASAEVRYASMSAATADEAQYLVDAGGSATGADFRFADGAAYMIYQFDLPDDVQHAYAHISVGNQFVIEMAAGADGTFVLEKDWVAETGEETHDNSNFAEYTFDLSSYLADNADNIVRIKFSDGVPADGWGPFLKRIVINNQEQTGGPTFQEVLNSEQLYGEDIHDEYNKGYYTVDLTPFLADNPDKEVFVKFTDGSTGDGWGPGIFWMAVYSGDIEIQSDRLVFNDLKTTLGDPANYGVDLLHRRYALAADKTLTAIVLPEHPATENGQAYLLAATLNAAATPPVLTIARTADQKVRISWPAAQPPYQLQQTATLASPTDWTDVAEPPQEADGVLSLEVTPDEAARFYRLVK